jgi:hypothetical protein
MLERHGSRSAEEAGPISAGPPGGGLRRLRSRGRGPLDVGQSPWGPENGGIHDLYSTA